MKPRNVDPLSPRKDLVTNILKFENKNINNDNIKNIIKIKLPSLLLKYEKTIIEIKQLNT